MPGPGHIFDHVERALGDLVSQFAKRTRIRGLIKIAAKEVQELEDVLYALIVERYLSTAVGAQLDQYGVIVGVPRDGLSDGEYRGFIAARILSNLTEGEPERLLKVLRIITGDGGPAHYMPAYPAGMILEYHATDPLSDAVRERIKTWMLEIAPAGVSIEYITESPPPGTYFGFADDDNALGFGEGSWSEMI